MALHDVVPASRSSAAPFAVGPKLTWDGEPLDPDQPPGSLTSSATNQVAPCVRSDWSTSSIPSSSGGAESEVRHVVAFGPDLRLDPRPVLTFERRLLFGDAMVAATTLWTLGFDDPHDAIRHHAWLLARPERWTAWGRLCALTGADVLAGDVLAGVEADERRERDEREAARMRAERDAELALTIDSLLVDRRGAFGVNLQRGGEVEPFWSIMFRERWERDRFLDWWRFQRHRFREFADFLEARSALDLERLLLGEMLSTEKASRKAGTSAGGRRPLRFWRGEA